MRAPLSRRPLSRGSIAIISCLWLTLGPVLGVGVPLQATPVPCCCAAGDACPVSGCECPAHRQACDNGCRCVRSGQDPPAGATASLFDLRLGVAPPAMTPSTASCSGTAITGTDAVPGDLARSPESPPPRGHVR